METIDSYNLKMLSPLIYGVAGVTVACTAVLIARMAIARAVLIFNERKLLALFVQRCEEFQIIESAHFADPDLVRVAAAFRNSFRAAHDAFLLAYMNDSFSDEALQNAEKAYRDALDTAALLPGRS